jgi:plasmid stabilization system protein ParE
VTRPVAFRRSAAVQIETAHTWWREHRPAAPFAIRDELARAIALIRVQPGLGAPATNVRLRGVRRILLSRVGYWLYYREGAERIDVLAFWHAKRGQAPTVRGEGT